MPKTIAVTGATGVQGGSVARKMLAEGWNVRALTRNPSSAAAQALAEQGAKVVDADIDKPETLDEAFEGAQAIFATTDFWQHLFAGHTAHEAGEREKAQGLALARAAARSSTLEHYVWSTLPSARKTSGGKFEVPHLDYKAEVDDIIRAEIPALAAKATFLFLGYYGSNMALFPFIKPIEWPGAHGTHIWLQPQSPNTPLANAGDTHLTPGLWTSAILRNPRLTHAKYALVAPETLTFAECLRVWSEVSGKRAVFVRCSVEDFVSVWGPAGEEFAAQMRWGDQVQTWTEGVEGGFVGVEELGIAEEVKRMGHRAALERIRGLGLL